MRVSLPTSVLLLVALQLPLSAKTGDSPPSTGIPELIEELGSDSYMAREKASKKLWDIGQAALVQLRQTAESDDPEMALRATDLLEKIELQITPDTPEEITALIRRFREAPQNNKLDLLNELKRRKAFFQVLKLYSMEENPETKAFLASSIRGVAISGAREAIILEDTETALKLLEMSADDPIDLMALACLYRSLGKLDAELENPQAPGNVSTDFWKIALLRAKGDLVAATEIAETSKQPGLLAGLKVLTGDPTLWLEQNGLADRNRQAHQDYIAISLKRWNGEKVQEIDYAALIGILQGRERDSDDRAFAASALAALGRLAEIEALLAKEEPISAFEYYLSLERISEALESLKLDPKNPDYTGWVATRFDAIFADNGAEDDTSREMAELGMMAAFMESRGMQKDFREAFAKPLRKYAVKNENHFLDFLSTLFQPIAAPIYAAEISKEWAGDDANRWSEIFTIASAEEDRVQDWLGWIAELEPDIKNEDKLDALLALLKAGADPGNLRKKWINLAWKAVDAAPANMKPVYIQRIRKLASDQEDVGNSLKAWDMLKGENASMWSSIDKYLSAAGRWDDAAEILDANGKFATSSSPELHAYLAATLRRAGLEKRAATHDAWADKLSLGYAPSCKRIGDYYTYGGDPKRAALWYQRAAFQSDPTENEFASALDSYAEAMRDQGNWQVAASCYEVLVQIYASRNFVNLPPILLAKARLSADLCKALAVLPEDRNRAVGILDTIHENFAVDGVLADDFFPLVKKAGLSAELNGWFADSWKRVSAVIEKFPESDNTRNTAAWLASRAGMKLKEAEKHLEYAIAKKPNQPAYLDTMAELNFASGNRKKAIEWSDRAIAFYPLTDGNSDLMIRKQNYRFRHAKFPK